MPHDLITNDNPAALPSVDTSRKLHIGHFAFMRALVQGADTKAAWERYLQIEGEHTDARIVRKTIHWIRDAFASAAKREHKFGTARLVLADWSKVGEREQQQPTLAQFVADRGLEGFSENDQIVAFLETYPAVDVQQKRRAKLMARQLDALRWLEELAAQPPGAGDPIASWISPDLTCHVQAAGLFTLRQLVTHINGIGKRWYCTIPAVGPLKAKRIEDWLRAHELSIGLALGDHVSVARAKLNSHQLARVVPRQTAIVPLDKLIVPGELDGSQGWFRAPRAQCMMRANNDYEAVLLWIKTRHGMSSEQKQAVQIKRGIAPGGPEGPMDWLHYLSHTQRAYLKEAERFILWAIVQHKKPLSSMTLEDCEAYRLFLASPTPSDLWCAPRGRDKWSPLWRPFEGPLSPSAQAHTLRILKSLYKFLVDQCYLVGNPWNGVTIPRASRVAVSRGRSFTQAQWAFIEQQAAQLSNRSADCRLRFALHLYYATGMRLIEGVQARVDDLRFVSYPDHESDEVVSGWELKVVGKGNKERIVQVPQDVVDELASYLASRGLDPDPEAVSNRGAYLLGQVVDVASRAPWSPSAQQAVDPKRGISHVKMYEAIKRFFQHCAELLAQSDPKSAQRLASGSTHWMRHTYGTHAVAAGMPLDVVQQNMGHASLDTTTGYTTSEERRRMKAAQAAWKKKPPIDAYTNSEQ
jgi:site-specific recombinase XerD